MLTKTGFTHPIEVPVVLKKKQMPEKRSTKQACLQNIEKARVQRAQNVEKSAQGVTSDQTIDHMTDPCTSGGQNVTLEQWPRSAGS
jgi:hypothetical protein